MRASLIACGIAGLGLVLLALAGPSYRIGLPLGVRVRCCATALTSVWRALVAIGTAAWQWKRSRGAAVAASAPWWD